MKQDSLGAYLVVGLLAAAAAVVLLWPRLSRPPELAPAASNTAAGPDAGEGSLEVGGAAPAPSVDPMVVDGGGGALCPAGMRYVAGMYCPFVAHRCAAYLGFDPEADGMAERDDETRRCQSYHDDVICEGRPASLRFCIDRFEYPNMEGVKPAIMVDYRQAKQACALDGKRLCEAEEWVFACEGPRTWPYPYGIERDPGACNVDRRQRRPNQRALAVPHDVSLEVERLDQRVPSGALPRCTSPFDVADMTGNVVEWVHNREAEDSEDSRPTALAGGYWGRIPATCRRLDASHGASHRSYRTGFRCCRDALDGRSARKMAEAGRRLPRRRRLLPKEKK